MYSCGLLHMDKQRLDDRLEPIYNCSVLIQDVAWRTSKGAMDDRNGWRMRVREIHASSATCCGWWYLYIHEGLAIRSTIYTCTFLKEINSNRSFHVPKDILYCSLHRELFSLSECQSVSLHRLCFQLGLLWQIHI